MRTVRWLDLGIIAAYMAGLVSLGIRFSRRQTSTDRYFVAKRSIPGWAMGMSLLATLISSVTFIAYPGSAYAGDWANLVPGLMAPAALAVTGLVVVPFYRHAVNMSAYEYFGKRFGYGARVYSSIAFALGHFSKMSFVFYLLALTVTSMTGWKTDSVIVLVGVVTVGYTLAGGIEAVIWADVIQGFVLWVGIAVCLGYLLLLPPGGPAAALAMGWHSHKMSLGSTAADFTRPTVPVLALYGFFFYLQKFTADQTVVQRSLVARSDRAALRGIALGSILCIPVWTLFMLIGTLCWGFYRSTGEKLPAFVTKADQVFPYFVTTHVAPGLAGFFLAALFGAAMATCPRT
jgi:SSS family solute:Na+ symporter